MSIIIYTSKNCYYCTRAKQLLDTKNVKYKIVDVTNSSKQRELLVKITNGLKTVPQIFINNHHIGGFNELNEMNINKKLDNLIKNYLIKIENV